MPLCPLPSAHRHLAQKALQALLRPLVAACHAHAARQPDQLADGRVHHRHRLAHLAVKRCLPVQQRHIALKPSKCTASAAAQLHGGLAARASLLLPGYFHPVLSFSVLFIAPRAPPRASQCRLRVPFSRSTRQNTASHPSRDLSPFSAGLFPFRSPPSSTPRSR